MESPEQYIERRSFERTLAVIECHCLNTEFFGTVVNLSETGIFVKSQKIVFPLQSQFDMTIPFKVGDMLSFSVKVNRLTKSNHYYDGMGLELLNPPQEFLDLVRSLRSIR